MTNVRHKRRSVLRAAGTVAAGVTVSGCGLTTGTEEPREVVGNPADLETTEIKVAALKTLDTAPLRLAQAKGLFGREGLNVEIIDIPAGPVGIEGLLSGEWDMSFSSYSPAYRADYTSVAKDVGGIKLIADATSLQPGNSVIAVSSDSPIREVTELHGKTIGVVGLNTMAHLLVLSVLDDHDVHPQDVRYVQLPFEHTGAALDNRVVDAAFLTEPMLTQSKKDFGVVTLQDTHDGSTEAMPLCGYAAHGEFVNQHPKVVAAISRVMQRATLIANEDRRAVEAILPTYVPGLTPDLATVVGMTRFESKLNPRRLQRVATLMSRFGLAAGDWTVNHMVIKPAPLTR